MNDDYDTLLPYAMERYRQDCGEEPNKRGLWAALCNYHVEMAALIGKLQRENRQQTEKNNDSSV